MNIDGWNLVKTETPRRWIATSPNGEVQAWVDQAGDLRTFAVANDSVALPRSVITTLYRNTALTPDEIEVARRDGKVIRYRNRPAVVHNCSTSSGYGTRVRDIEVRFVLEMGPPKRLGEVIGGVEQDDLTEF